MKESKFFSDDSLAEISQREGVLAKNIEKNPQINVDLIKDQELGRLDSENNSLKDYEDEVFKQLFAEINPFNWSLDDLRGKLEFEISELEIKLDSLKEYSDQSVNLTDLERSKQEKLDWVKKIDQFLELRNNNPLEEQLTEAIKRWNVDPSLN